MITWEIVHKEGIIERAKKLPRGKHEVNHGEVTLPIRIQKDTIGVNVRGATGRLRQASIYGLVPFADSEPANLSRVRQSSIRSIDIVPREGYPVVTILYPQDGTVLEITRTHRSISQRVGTKIRRF